LEETFNQLYEALEESTSNCKSNYLALSGGLDSTILAYYLKEKKINSLTIITKDFLATDLTYCQLVSKKLGIKLDIKMVRTDEIISAIEETIKILGNFNDIEIRNSIVMFIALSKIKEAGYDSIITGDGADELFAGYSFFLKKDQKDLGQDLERIWRIMHFPVTEMGKAMKIKVECPFLSEKMIEIAKKIPVIMKVREENGKKYGKWILRKAFENKIPRTIAWRDKSPLQDGAGTIGLIDLFETLIPDNIFETKIKKIQQDDDIKIRSKESLHYYEIYKKYFKLPITLHSSERACPFCHYKIDLNSKFCRMCGTYPI